MRVDPTTLLDLAVLDPGEETRSLFDTIDRTSTAAGRTVLRAWMRRPLPGADARRRQNAVRHLSGHLVAVQEMLDAARPDDVEQYLSLKWQALTRTTRWGQWRERLVLRLVYPHSIREIRLGLASLDRLLEAIERVNHFAADTDALRAFGAELDELLRELREFQRLRQSHSLKSILFADRLARGRARNGIRRIVAIVAEMDALHSLAKATIDLGWSFPELTDDGRNLEVHGLRHPALVSAISNDVILGGSQRVMAITGPNMAGKSTLLKAVGSAVYLAHVGSGVPAARAVIPCFDVMVTSLVIRDSVTAGRSFFLSEVRRVRELIATLSEGQKVFAILDEPFKGTNIEDASEATDLLIRGLCAQDGSLIILTTHLATVIERIESDSCLSATFLAAEMESGDPRFDYQLRPGVSRQRLGMLLLEREGVAPALVAAIERRTRL